MKKNYSQMKTALITGVTGQDGSYLAELLLEKGYRVIGVRKRSSVISSQRIDHLFVDASEYPSQFELHYGDLTDSLSMIRLLSEFEPDEIYNLGGQSHVPVSFQNPEYTADSAGLGTLRLLEAVRFLKIKARIYQASTSEMYGGLSGGPYNEDSEMDPRSPYAASKVFAHNLTKMYREAYNMYCCSGILFNHESPRRSAMFVTRKITLGIAKIKQGKAKELNLGNIYSIRDWGHAKDYVVAMWEMLQRKNPEDYVISTGEGHTVKEFAEIAFKAAGMPIHWEGEGTEEVGKTSDSKVVVRINKRFFRPLEVDKLIGDSSKAEKGLAWKREYSFENMIVEMVKEDNKRVEENNYY